MITALLSLLGSSAVGTILGSLFAWLNKKTDLDVKRLELEHERSRWAHDLQLRDKDLELAKAEAQGCMDVAVVEGDAVIESARMAAIGQSQLADQITADDIRAAGRLGWLLVLGKALRTWIRPVATVILAAAAIYLNWLLIDKLAAGWQSLTLTQRYELGIQAFAWITGQAGAALGYWFVSRGTGK